jgi:hypothetical protein
MPELDIDVVTYSMAGGEYEEHTGRVPDLVVECLEHLLRKLPGDAQSVELLERLRKG